MPRANLCYNLLTPERPPEEVTRRGTAAQISENLFNLGDVHYTDLLVVLGQQVFQKARDSGVKLSEDRLHDLLFWYTTHVFEKSEQGKTTSEVGGELDAVFARFNMKLVDDAPYRREIVRAQTQANLADLLERLNGLLEWWTCVGACSRN